MEQCHGFVWPRTFLKIASQGKGKTDLREPKFHTQKFVALNCVTVTSTGKTGAARTGRGIASCLS